MPSPDYAAYLPALKDAVARHGRSVWPAEVADEITGREGGTASGVVAADFLRDKRTAVDRPADALAVSAASRSKSSATL